MVDDRRAGSGGEGEDRGRGKKEDRGRGGGESRGEINRGIRVTNGENEKGENEGEGKKEGGKEGKKEGRKKGGWKVEETLMRRNVV